MIRLASRLALLSAVTAVGGWSLCFGEPSGNRVSPGKGTFPRWAALTVATEAPLRWLVPLPPSRMAGVDRSGTLWILDVARGGLSVAGRYGEAVGRHSPPVAVRLGGDMTGVALVGRDGRLVVWGDGVLRSYDVGAPLSRLTSVVPVSLSDRGWDDLLAVAADGGLLLIGHLPAGPRVLARVEARALADTRITLADLDGDGVPEAVVLTDGTDRYPHSTAADRIEAGAVTVIGLTPNGLTIRARHPVAPPAVFEERVAVLAPLGGPHPAVLLARSTAAEGTGLVALGWRDGGLVGVADGPGSGQGHRWSHVLGAADVSGDGAPEILAVRSPGPEGVLTAYRRRGSALVVIAQTAGYASHASGSRTQDQAVIADLDGNGRPEVVVARPSRDAVAALELDGGRFVERWSVAIKGPLESNLIASDLDGDGLLDLALADRRGLHVYLSAR